MAFRMDAGQLRHTLVLQQADYVPDQDGGYTTNWSDVANLWGALTPVRAEALLRAGANEMDVTHRIVVRHTDAVKPDMRFRKGTRIFTVITVNDLDETGRYTVALTREGAA